MLAVVTLQVDPYQYATEVLITLLVLAGVTFLVGNIVLGQAPVSSGPTRARKRLVWRDSFSPVPEGEVQTAPAGAADLPAPGTLRERRTSLRREGSPVDVLVAVAAEGEPVQAAVLNRSTGGLCVFAGQPVGVGTVLRVRAANAPEDLPWIEVRVRRCEEKGEGWELGCQFVETLPWSVLLLFG